MKTGTLTPKANNIEDAMRFSGCFGQPDGFGSMLDVTVNTEGKACLTLTWKTDTSGGEEKRWSITLDSDQRNALASMLAKYQPRTWERYKDE